MKNNNLRRDGKCLRSDTRTTGTTVSQAVAILALSLGISHAAKADTWDNHMFSAAVGTTVGGSHVEGPSGASAGGFSSELNLRLHGLYILGLDFAYAPVDGSITADGLTYGNSLRLSALVYLIPTAWFSLYAKVGIEADGFGGLFDWDAAGTAYHGGAGMEIPITDNWYVGAEFLMLVPGAKSVTDHVSTVIETETNRIRSGLSSADNVESLIPTASDYLSANNFRLSASVRYYF